MASADVNDQCSQIRGLLQRHLKSGDCWYMVDWKWMKQWKKYVGYDPHRSRSVSAADKLRQQGWFEKGQPSAHPGPVDNADLFLNISDPYTVEDVRLLSAYLYFLSHKWRELGFQLGLSQELLDAISQAGPPVSCNDFPVHEYHFRLMLIAWIRQLNGKNKPSLLARALSAEGADTWNKWSILVQTIKDHLWEEREFFFLPEAAWKKVVEWYGITDGSRPIQRAVVEPGPYVKQNTIEVYPLKLKLCRHPQLEKLTTVPFSKGHTIGFLEEVMRKFYAIPIYVESRVRYRCSSQHYELLKDPQLTLQNTGISNGQVIMLEVRNRNGTWPGEGEIEEISSTTDSFNIARLLKQVEDLEKQIASQNVSLHFAAQNGGFTPSLNPFLVPDTTSIIRSAKAYVPVSSLPVLHDQLREGSDHQLVESLRKRITDLEHQLNESQRAKQDVTQNYQRRLSAVQQQSSELGQQLITCQLQLQESRLAAQEATKKKNSLEQHLQAAQEAQKESALQISTLQQQASALQQRLQTARQQLCDSQQAAQTAQATVERLQHQLQQSQQATHEVQQQLTRVTQNYQEAQHRTHELEQSLGAAERRLSNSDETFRDVLQRLLGQVPHSQPLWVVQRNEIELSEEELGTGGWASVRVAHFRGQRVAAKCLHHQILSAHNIRLFTREMNMAAQARHPNLLQFIGATMDNTPIILTELMPTSLRRILEEGIHLTHRQILSIASDVARGLNYLHLVTPDPIIHRDVSSANVLLEAYGEGNYKAKVSDYGSANFVRYTATAGPGNPLYSAPEAHDPKRHSPKMDVYSFGILLVEMCSGELFDDHEELIRTRIHDWPEMVRVIRPCIRPEPDRRPTMTQVLTELAQLNV